MYLYIILFFLIGLLCSIFFNNIWYRLPIDRNVFEDSTCDNCGHLLKNNEIIPLFSFIKQRGKCNYCKEKISKMYPIFEILLGILFSIVIINNYDSNIILSLIFISSLLIIMFSDIKYMLIPDELLFSSSILVIVFKLINGFYTEELTNFIDAGYLIINMIVDALVMFVIMYLIKKIGDMLFKKESLGGGDIKMMSFIALIMGYKMSILIIFIGSFIALPFSIYNAYKKNEVMLPFGPYLAIATMLLYICKINFDMFLDFIH